MERIYRLAALFIIMGMLFSGCKTLPMPSKMVKAPEAANQIITDSNMEEIVLKLLPKGGKLIVPKNPVGFNSIQRVDIDVDGKEEILATYRVNGVKLEVVAALFKENDGLWEEQWRISSPGYEFDWVGFANLTDLEQMELIVAADSTGGDISARGVKIFTMETGKPKEIYSTIYEDMDIIYTNETSGVDDEDELVLWFKQGTFSSTVESYKLEKINNEYVLMPDSEGNQYFLKNVLPQYEQKMDMLDRIRDSWRYFYCYADVKLKNGEPGYALGAIENGLDRAESGGDRAKIKLLLLKAEALNELGNSKKALEILENTLGEINKLGQDELKSGFEALTYLELANIYSVLMDTDKAKIYHALALEAGKKACKDSAYESAAQVDNMPFYEHYLKVDSIEKDFKVKFIYSIEER